MLERQAADKQAHRESDAAENRRAIQCGPVYAIRQRRKLQLHSEETQREYAQLLAQEQAGRNTQGDRM